MQIEEAFRDLKNHPWGFGLRYARSANPESLHVLLLIGLLASFVLWLLGLAGKARGVQRQFQANTEARRNVLPIPFLGQQLLRCGRFRFSLDELQAALAQL